MNQSIILCKIIRHHDEAVTRRPAHAIRPSKPFSKSLLDLIKLFLSFNQAEVYSTILKMLVKKLDFAYKNDLKSVLALMV